MSYYVLIPFAVYGLFVFAKWWLHMIWQRETDVYNSKDDGFVFLPTIITMFWIITTILFYKGLVLNDIWTLYLFETIFGPLSFVLVFVRFFGFGYTKLGKLLGCYPPTKD